MASILPIDAINGTKMSPRTDAFAKSIACASEPTSHGNQGGLRRKSERPEIFRVFNAFRQTDDISSGSSWVEVLFQLCPLAQQTNLAKAHGMKKCPIDGASMSHRSTLPPAGLLPDLATPPFHLQLMNREVSFSPETRYHLSSFKHRSYCLLTPLAGGVKDLRPA